MGKIWLCVLCASAPLRWIFITQALPGALPLTNEQRQQLKPVNPRLQKTKK